MLTFWMWTPSFCACVRAPASQLGNAGSSAGPVDEPAGPDPVSDTESGLLCSRAKLTASWKDHPAALRPGVGLYWLALAYCQKCARSTALEDQAAALICVVPPVDQSV